MVFEESRLTYRELDSRAELLAGHLRALGVGPEVFVAVAMERSPDLVVALLAILKAGGAFVPVDPGYPLERIAWLLADSGAPVRVSETRFLTASPRTECRRCFSTPAGSRRSEPLRRRAGCGRQRRTSPT